MPAITAAAQAALLADAANERPVGEDSIEQMRSLAEQQLVRENDVAKAEAALADAKDRLAKIAEHELPDFMERNGITRHQWTDHAGISHLIEFIAKWRVSMPSKQIGKRWVKDEAACLPVYAWLRDIGQGGVVKRDVEIPVGLMPLTDVEAFMAELKQTHPTMDPGFSERVEPATLLSLISKMKEAGKNVHQNIRVTPFRTSKIT